MRFDPKAFKGKRACVIGLGKSGQGVARLLAAKGFRVLGSDTRPRAELKKALARLPARVAWEGGGHSDRVLSCAFAVKSPGLAPSLPVFARLKEAGVPVFSELEVALAFSKCREVVAITGTNGKTTTTALTAEIFARGRRGRKVLACGNIGLPISEAAPKAGPKDTLVAEVSSYQLEDSAFFAPAAGAVLNVTADHLEHHGGMRNYLDAKARVFRDQGEGDVCVFNAEDALTLQLSRRCPSRRLFFGKKGPSVHAWVEGGRIRARLPGAKKESSFAPPPLPGEHNLQNAMAAVLLALARGVKGPAIQQGLKAFRGIEHRIEECGVARGLRGVNDSKATNVDSTLMALRSLAGERASKNILLILGGLHKGLPYTPLKPLIESSVKGILTIGSAARKVEEDLSGIVPIFPCGDMRTAVATAFTVGRKGDVLLLSPACASFDQFQDFEDRGRQFKQLFKEMK